MFLTPKSPDWGFWHNLLVFQNQKAFPNGSHYVSEELRTRGSASLRGREYTLRAEGETPFQKIFVQSGGETWAVDGGRDFVGKGLEAGAHFNTRGYKFAWLALREVE